MPDFPPAPSAIRSADEHTFGGLVEPHRRELQVHCYRILGSLHDAEDLTQETLLRAWRRRETFEGRASFRAWLYKIATNACFDALDRRPRRALPTLTHPVADPAAQPAPLITEPVWLEPLPDELVAEADENPEARYSACESVTLAFLAALQTLPPRQRAVIILCDVLDWQAAEAADCLAMTVSAVNSALHRARITLAKHYHGEGRATVQRARDAQTQHLLERYVRAWEAADVAALVGLLKEDVIFAMPPVSAWFRGREAIRVVLRMFAFPDEARDRWRMTPMRANGSLAVACYQRDAAGSFRASGVQVLSFSDGLIAESIFFLEPALVARFGLPLELPVTPSPLS